MTKPATLRFSGSNEALASEELRKTCLRAGVDVRERPLHERPTPWLALTKNLWLEVPVDDDWMAAYRFVNQDGSPVVAELRLFPREPEFKKKLLRPRVFLDT